MVQHAWSAVSHTVQYKREMDIPSPFRRRLHRIAGLFELADEEFVAIRNQRKSLKESAISNIADGNTDIPINADSVSALLATWKGIPDLVSSASNAGFIIDDDVYDDDANYVGTISNFANKIGMRSIEDLESALSNIDQAYLDQLCSESRGEWYSSPEFIALLILIYSSDGKITKSDLVQTGFEDGIAARVIRVASSVRADAKENSKRSPDKD